MAELPEQRSAGRRWWQRASLTPPAPSALELLALERGWTLSESDPALQPLLEQAPMRLAPGHVAAPVVSAQVGSWQSLSFEIRFDDKGRRSRPLFCASVIAVPIPLPALRVAPRRFLTPKASGMLVLPSVDPSFDARWQVLAAQDTGEIRGLVAEPLRAALTDSPDLDELWTAAGYLAVSRVDGYQETVLDEHAALLLAAMTGLQAAL